MQIKNIGTTQLHIIDGARRYLRDMELRGINVATSALCYLVTWAPVLGYAKLQYWQKGWSYLGRYTFIFIRDIIGISTHSSYVVKGGSGSRNRYTQFVVSWSRREDFQTDGSFLDRYFKTNSREKPEALWFLISLDGAVPDSIDENIRIFSKTNRVIKYDIFFLIKTVVTIFIKCKGSPRKILHALSSASVFAQEIALAVTDQLRIGTFNKVLLTYEAQPFHHSVFYAAKSFSPEIRTIGYLHSALPPLPTDLIFRSGAPDLLLVHGIGQAQILKSQLDWPAESLRVIPSLRYRREEKISFANQIFFPYAFSDEKLLIQELKKFLNQTPYASLPPLTVRNHPQMEGSKKHLKLKRKLEEILTRYGNRFSPEAPGSQISIFIGATAAILEALERGVNVIHICADPLFESHSEDLWTCLEVKRFSTHVFGYRLRSQEQYITLGSEQYMFEKYCDL